MFQDHFPMGGNQMAAIMPAPGMMSNINQGAMGGMGGNMNMGGMNYGSQMNNMGAGNFNNNQW